MRGVATLITHFIFALVANAMEETPSRNKRIPDDYPRGLLREEKIFISCLVGYFILASSILIYCGFRNAARKSSTNEWTDKKTIDPSIQIAQARDAGGEESKSSKNHLDNSHVLTMVICVILGVMFAAANIFAMYRRIYGRQQISWFDRKLIKFFGRKNQKTKESSPTFPEELSSADVDFHSLSSKSDKSFEQLNRPYDGRFVDV
ncbi:hypothetical protein BS50DRAFT_631421 [Corynespora cassiicola Philippines]|uniref:Uncharacterized protein n=1 Tax=Corynespora cassiicola Philippines TaxID=1448308 RepID=A0A2T2P1D1_CORCC|nr:hypothetical protein BS50DRAFT_631421 [Corynespora cassiicola Philippines]